MIYIETEWQGLDLTFDEYDYDWDSLEEENGWCPASLTIYGHDNDGHRYETVGSAMYNIFDRSLDFRGFTWSKNEIKRC